ncbi:MAG: hypothetical protein II543_07520, partial [Desulfovibrio sp.]|nr:hypothetical protein [Desulfovibrio sp.]
FRANLSVSFRSEDSVLNNNGETRRRAMLYVNANEFLSSIGRDPESALFPQESAKWRPECSLEPWMASLPPGRTGLPGNHSN